MKLNGKMHGDLLNANLISKVTLTSNKRLGHVNEISKTIELKNTVTTVCETLQQYVRL